MHATCRRLHAKPEFGGAGKRKVLTGGELGESGVRPAQFPKRERTQARKAPRAAAIDARAARHAGSDFTYA